MGERLIVCEGIISTRGKFVKAPVRARKKGREKTPALSA